MILSFLRLINHHLLADLARMEHEKALLQDRLERRDQECSHLWESNSTLQRELTSAYRMQINVELQKKGAPAPWPDEYHLPPEHVHPPDSTPMPTRLTQGSQLVDDATRRFRERALTKLQATAGK